MHFFVKSFSFVVFAYLAFGTISAAEKADIIVAKSGGDFTTIQAAINSVSATNGKNVIILVKNGTYSEHLGIDKSYISIIGESREKTIIQFSIEREAWAAKNGSTAGCAVLNIGCTSAFKKASSMVTDVIIGNLTVENTFNSATQKTMAIKDEGNSNRIFVVNCNVWSKGHDTISLWTGATGMYYHADCSFKGALDFVCPRGWCYIVNSDFYATATSAPLWHEVAAGSSQKFVVRGGRFLPDASNSSTFKLLNSNNSSNLGTRFILLDCIINSRCNSKGSATEAYFYNCKGESASQSWYTNNLTTLAVAPTQDLITAKWTFDNKWDPENTLSSVLPFSAIPQPWNNAYGLTASVQLKWIKGRNAEQNAIYFGTSATPAFVKTQIENTYTPGNLASGKYYWRVDAISATDTVKGAVWSFAVDKGVFAKVAKKEALSSRTFNVIQSNSSLLFNYTLEKNENVIIKVFNLQGKEIVSLPVANRNAGAYCENMQITNFGLSKGMYIANLNVGSMKKTVVITLQ